MIDLPLMGGRRCPPVPTGWGCPAVAGRATGQRRFFLAAAVCWRAQGAANLEIVSPVAMMQEKEGGDAVVERLEGGLVGLGVVWCTRDQNTALKPLPSR